MVKFDAPVAPEHRYCNGRKYTTIHDYGNVYRLTIDGKRWYTNSYHFANKVLMKYPTDVNTHIVPSVTTILSEIPNLKLDEWKERMGPMAERIGAMARQRGTDLHSCCEAYLTNQTHFPVGITQDIQDLFIKIHPVLDKIHNIQFIEQPMIGMKYAGTPDVIAQIDLRNFNFKEYDTFGYNVIPKNSSIIDFKTSKNIPTKDKVDNYFVQLCAYRRLWEERYPKYKDELVRYCVPENYVLIFAVENEPIPFIYSSPIREWNFIDGRWQPIMDQFDHKWNDIIMKERIL